jgi:hypothetical protein
VTFFYSYITFTLKGIVLFHNLTTRNNIIVGILLVTSTVLFLTNFIAHLSNAPLPLPILEFLDFLVNGRLAVHLKKTTRLFILNVTDVTIFLKIFLIKKK